MNRHFTLRKFVLAILLLSAIASCKKDETEDADVLEARANLATITIPNINFFALSANKLDVYSAQSPESVSRSMTITGLQSGENIVAIDFRPANGQLYGIASSGQLYLINKTSGAAAKVGTTPVALTDAIAAFDFNPTVDRIRLITGSGQNFRLHPETGVIAATDGNINGQANAKVAAAAYTNNMTGATTTTLFDIDVVSGQLFSQVPPNNGTLVPIGTLEVTVSGEGGFDIAPANNFGLAFFTERGKPTLLAVNLTTGRATPIAKYKADANYTAIAIPTID